MKAIISGVYILFDGLEVVYVGQSSDIYRRIYEHSSGRAKGLKKVFDEWEYFEVKDELQRDRMESLLIKVLSPKYNIDHPTPKYWKYKCDEKKEKRKEKTKNIERFARRLDKYSQSVNAGECDEIFGFPRGTFYDLIKTGKMPEQYVYKCDDIFEARIKVDALEEIAKKLSLYQSQEVG